jgi:ethanolamine kinase
VARRLAEWHAILPIVAEEDRVTEEEPHFDMALSSSASAQIPKHPATLAAIRSITPNKLAPNLWTVMQKWIFALPAGTKDEKSRKATLQHELEFLVEEMADRPGFGKDGVCIP